MNPQIFLSACAFRPQVCGEFATKCDNVKIPLVTIMRKMISHGGQCKLTLIAVFLNPRHFMIFFPLSNDSCRRRTALEAPVREMCMLLSNG